MKDSDWFFYKKVKVIHEHNNNNESPSAYNVENPHQNNKEITDKLIEQYEARLKEKDELIGLLKGK